MRPSSSRISRSVISAHPGLHSRKASIASRGVRCGRSTGSGGESLVSTPTVRSVCRFGLGRGFGGGIGNSGTGLALPAHPHVLVLPLLRLSPRAMVASPQSQRQCHRAPPPPLLGALARTRRPPKRLPVSSTALRTVPPSIVLVSSAQTLRDEHTLFGD
jgi:hypothetical protein